MLLQASKRLRKFFDSGLSNEQIWQEIIDEGRLEHLHQLTALNTEAAGAMIRIEKRMELLSLGITELHSEVAVELAKYKGDKLFLNCIRELSPEAARELSRFKGSKLALNGLNSVDLPLMGRLSAYKGAVILDGVESVAISQKEVKRGETVFGNLQFGILSLAGLKEVPLFLLRVLSRYRGQLKLNGITQLDEEQSQVLSGFLGKALSLKGIREITPEMAVLLSSYHGFLDFSGAGEIDGQLLEDAASRKEGYSLFSAAVKREVDRFKQEQTLHRQQRSEEKWQRIREEEETRREENKLLAELEAFEIPEEKPSEAAAFEIVAEAKEESIEAEIGQDVLDDIEINLNLKISQKRRRVNELLSKGKPALSPEETAEMETLEREIGELNDQIKGALDILLERKELGAVVFNSSSDLAAYLKESGARDDEYDALAGIEDTDLFRGSF